MQLDTTPIAQHSGPDLAWLVWFAAAAISLIVIFALVRLFFIDSKMQDVIDRLDKIIAQRNSSETVNSTASKQESAQLLH